MLKYSEIKAVTAPLPSARTLPPAAYTSREIFTAESQRIFGREWVCVAREEQLPEPGDYQCVDVVDQPLILVRLEDGALHAMSAVCAHRAMLIAEGSGNTRHFQCPYHLWRYELDGTLASAPLMEGVDVPANCRLPAVRVETWNGFVFVNLDPTAPALNPRLARISDIVAPFAMDNMAVVSTSEWDCPWNWKILVENFMEAYHHLGPHSESVQPTHAAKDSSVSGSVIDGWSVLHMPPREAASDPARAATLACVIMPTLCWLNVPELDGAFWYQLLPQAHDRMKLLLHVLVPKALAEGPERQQAAEGMQAVIDSIHTEDILVNEGPWKGLNSPLATQGPLSLLEESIWQLNQWWVERLELGIDPASNP